MNNNEIRVKVNGGYIVAGKLMDPNYPGVYVTFETNDGDSIDIAVVESKVGNHEKTIDTYCYENVCTEDWTHKYTLGIKEIYDALYGGN